MGKTREIIRISHGKMKMQRVAACLCMLFTFVFAADLHAAKTYTITATAGSGGSISPSGAVVVNSGGSKTFTITPNTGYHVADVKVDNVSQGAITSYTFTNVRANHTINATFAINTYTITGTAGSNGAISPSGAVVVNYGSNQTLTITPNTGYHVADVTVDGASQGAITSYTFTNVITNHTIAATFAINTYTITATAGSNGTISPSGAVVVNYAGSQTFTITPNTGYHVADVTVDGISQGAITGYTFTNVTADYTITASFAINTYTITAMAGTGGSISPSGAVTVNYGANQSFTVTPNIGYNIADVTVDSISQGAITSYTFTNVTSNHTIAATFVANSIALTIDSPSDGATINRPDVMVIGTVTNPGGYETGVTVNGVAAIVYGNQFVANHVPLQEGANTMTATATDVNGTTATASGTVNAVTAGTYIRLTADTASGVAPLDATLRVDGTFSISASTLSATGPVQPEILSSSADQYQVRMTPEGIYYFTASATGPDGNPYQDSVAIMVTNQNQMDIMFRGKWDGMRSALAIGDLNTAINFFEAGSQETYRTQFTTLQPVLGAISNEMGQINLVKIVDSRAEYEIITTRNGVTYSFYLLFVKDRNGLWKIKQF